MEVPRSGASSLADGRRPAAGAEPAPLLEVSGVEASYGPLQVLFGIDMDVPTGGRVALLGTNGAGKSTLLRVVAGLLPPDAGTVRFKGQDVTGMRPEERVRLGLTLVEGGRATFPSLTVLENLRIGAYPRMSDSALVDERLEEVFALFPALKDRLDQQAGTLSGGEQQMMVLGRALMAGPELLLIDELSLGLEPVVMQAIVAAVEQMVASGRTLLLVEQSLNLALGLADKAFFMEKGEIRFSGPTARLLKRGDLVRSVFFGDDRKRRRRR